MGASNSKPEEDKALQLCRERKKFVKQALDGRCLLAATHVTYIQSLKNAGTALGKFVEPEVSTESSLYTSTSATPEPLALTEKSLSQFSSSPLSASQHVDAAEIFSPNSSPPHSGRFRVNHMKAGNVSSRTVEERPFPITRTLNSSSSKLQNLTPPSADLPVTSSFQDSQGGWDYFGLSDSIDNEFSFQHGRGLNDDGLENHDDIRRIREEAMRLREEEELKSSFGGSMDSEESEDEFDEPSTENLVRSFENRNRVLDSQPTNTSPSIPSARSIAGDAKPLNEDKTQSPDLSPLRATASVVPLPIDDQKIKDEEAGNENKVAPKDFLSSIKEIEILFHKASESGREVPRMLEANKFHFRPIFPGKEGQSRTSIFLKACFSCGEDPSQVLEEPAATAVKYLTWHRTTSSHSSSSRNLLGSASKENIEDINSNLFSCMNSGSHASTLDRLYAWERKLYDEVKASGVIRSEYDNKCKLLRQLESNGEKIFRIDRTRAVVKDLHSRIRVAIHRIDSISKRIEELRDNELQPQLEELIQGLSRMWEMMSECHNLQLTVIRLANTNGSKLSLQSESHQHATSHLEHELSSLSSSFTKWINAQKSYLRAINGWLNKCVFIPQKPSRRKRRSEQPLRDLGPPIYATCDVWLEQLNDLPTKDVADSVKVLAAETTSFLPRHEKNQGKGSNQSFLSARKAVGNDEAIGNALGEEPSQDWDPGLDRFQSSLVGVLEQFNNFAQSSVKMYIKLQEAIQEAKSRTT